MIRRPLAVALACTGLLARPAGAQELPVRIDAEVRVRPELDARHDEPDADPAVSLDPDFATLLRTRLGVRARVSDHAKIYVQVQDARAFGEETGTLADGSADALDLHQTYVDLTGEVGELPFLVRAGRQEMKVGNERLVGAVGWTNTGRSFDGIRGQLLPEEASWRVDAWATQVDENDRLAPTGLDPRQNEGADEDHTFFGVGVDGGSYEAYFLHDRNARSGAFDGIDRSTLWGRVARTAYGWLAYQFEAAYQFGNHLADFGGDEPPFEQDIAAWMATGRLGWTGASGALRDVHVALDYLSGDSDPASDEYEAFNTLYATNHGKYGFMDFFTNVPVHTNDRGLVDGFVGAGLRLGNAVSLKADLHQFWLAEESPGGESAVGTELDLTIPVALPGGGSLQGGYSFFVNGAAAPAIGLGDEDDLLHWAYLQLTVSY